MRRLVRMRLTNDCDLRSPAMLIIDCHAHVTSRDEKRYPLKADPLQIPDDKGALEDLWEVSAANGVSAVRAIHTILSYNYETAICAMCRGTTRNGSPVSAH